MRTQKNSFTKWKSAADAIMLRIYGINTEDSGVDDDRLKSHWSMGQPPNEFVQWFGEKYDLISKKDMGIEGWW